MLRTQPSGLYASIIGDGNDVYVFDGNEIRLVGDNNFLSSTKTDRVFVEGSSNTFTFDNFPSVLEINGTDIPDYLGSISYVGSNAFGSASSGLSGGTGQLPFIPYDEHRGTDDDFLIAIPAPVEQYIIT